ncbi:MAG: hypothetical protein WBA22_05015 [Candidatus Methanofastidiosia archaeon]
MKTSNSKFMKEIIDFVELNFENLSWSTMTLSDIFGIFPLYFPLVFATTVFICFLIYIRISESESDVAVGVVTILFALITLFETNKERKRKLKDIEIMHNLRKIKIKCSNEKLFKTLHPIISALLSLKQKYPETDLRQLYKLNENLFTEEALLGLNLYDSESRDWSIQKFNAHFRS